MAMKTLISIEQRPFNVTPPLVGVDEVLKLKYSSDEYLTVRWAARRSRAVFGRR